MGDQFRLSIQLDTKKDTTEIKKGMAQFGKDLLLMAMNHGLAASMSVKLKISEIRDMPKPLQVKRGDVEKKAFITRSQIVAKKRLRSLDNYSNDKQRENERVICMLQLLSDCENVVKL